MKIILLNSCFVLQRKDYLQGINSHIRIGIASMASYLRENGVQVSIEDPQSEGLSLDEIVQTIIEKKPDFVGFPAYTEEIKHAAAIADQIKIRNPKIITIVGGPHASALPTETLKNFKSFDIAVMGEGEHTILDIVRGKDKKEILGIAYKENEDIIKNPPRDLISSLDELPFPDFDLYKTEKYGKILPIEPLRGCPFRCNFCFRVNGRKMRYKSPARIVDEIEHNIKKFGITDFRFLAGTFPLQKEHGKEVCKELLNRNLRIRWRSSTRVDTVDRELLKLMKKSGCHSLNIGVESGDPEILGMTSKGISIDDVIETFKNCKEEGIEAKANFIIGLPSETNRSILKTHNLALKIRKYATSANFAILVPFPGTEIYRKAQNNEDGLSLKSIDWNDYGKQAGSALVNKNFPGKRLIIYQTLLYLSYRLNSPLKLLELVTRNSGRTFKQAFRRFFA